MILGLFTVFLVGFMCGVMVDRIVGRWTDGN
jgi:hypothetical protein